MRTERIMRFLLAFMLAASGLGYAQSGTCTEILSVPTTITNPGVYWLTGNLRYNSQVGTAITVDSNGVVIDFNQYRLLYGGGAGGSAVGVSVGNGHKNVIIRNGLISDFADGIRSIGAEGIIIEDMRLSENTTGIWVSNIGGDGAIIRRNFFRSSTTAILVSGNSIVVDNEIIGKESDTSVGIRVSGDSLVVGNRLSRLTTGILYVVLEPPFPPTTIGFGKYRDNLTTDVATPYSGGTDAGNNN